MTKIRLLGILLASLSMFSFAASAQTPDGETPANEGVCDVLQGGTPGLYGLCVAFCEAQDIASVSDPITDEELFAIESGTPSGRILANYNRKKTENDIAMPCIKVEQPCPCFSAAEVAEVDGVSPTGGIAAIDCRTNGDPRSNIINENGYAAGRINIGSFLDADPNSREFNRGFCYYSNTQVSPRISRSADTGFFSTRGATMTPAQAAQCSAIVRTACDAKGL